MSQLTLPRQKVCPATYHRTSPKAAVSRAAKVEAEGLLREMAFVCRLTERVKAAFVVPHRSQPAV